MTLNANPGQPPEVLRQLVERVITELQGRHHATNATSMMAGVFERYIAEFFSSWIPGSPIELHGAILH